MKVLRLRATRADLKSALVATGLVMLCGFFWTACKDDSSKADPVAKGRGIYMLHCIACHNPNPAMDGAVGPAIKGSALELIQARVLRGEYPAGYTPKRPTRIMQRLPLEQADVEALHAFLNAP